MRLADDEIGITAGDETILLRPTLRAALRLERRHGGFDKLLEAIMGGNVTVIADIIREGAIEPSLFPAFLEGLDDMPLRSRLVILVRPLMAFVMQLAGVDADQPRQGAQAHAGKTTFSEYHTKLFGIATGWLGWTPETAWTSTPAEIVAAYKARLDMLKAIFGGKNDDDALDPNGEFDATGFAKLRFMAASGQNRAS